MIKIQAVELTQLNAICTSALNTTVGYSNFDPSSFGLIQGIQNIEENLSYEKVTNIILEKPQHMNEDHLSMLFWNTQIQPYTSDLIGPNFTTAERHILQCIYRYRLAVLIGIQILHNNGQLSGYEQSCDKEDFLDKTERNKLKELGFDVEKIRKHYTSEIKALTEGGILELKTEIENEDNSETDYKDIENKERRKNKILVMILCLLIVTIPIAFMIRSSYKKRVSERNSRFTKPEVVPFVFHGLFISDVERKLLAEAESKVEGGIRENNFMHVIHFEITSSNPKAIVAAIKERSLGLEVNYDVEHFIIRGNEVKIAISATTESLEGEFGKSAFGMLINQIIGLSSTFEKNAARFNPVDASPLTEIFENDFTNLAEAKAVSRFIDEMTCIKGRRVMSIK